MNYTYDYFLKAFNEAKNTARNLVSDLNDDVFLMRLEEGKWFRGRGPGCGIALLFYTSPKFYEALFSSY